MYKAEVIADSTAFGVRLTTMEVVFPRFILAEFNTHRMLSRNSASSRAIPVERRIAQVRENPFVPEAFSKAGRGMMSNDGIAEQNEARAAWLTASMDACRQAEALVKLGVHKQHANRLLEPFCWHTVVVSATEWANFFALRCHPAAQPEMQITANLMREAYEASTPRELIPGAWHLPYVREEDFYRDIDDDAAYFDALIKISVARCAAISYERQNVEKPIEEYVTRHDDLLANKHMSPFEHQAQVAPSDSMNGPPFGAHWEAIDACAVFNDMLWARSTTPYCGNFAWPFLQYRKMLPGEAVAEGAK